MMFLEMKQHKYPDISKNNLLKYRQEVNLFMRYQDLTADIELLFRQLKMEGQYLQCIK